MYIILGATGHVGSVVAKKLLASGKPVTIVTRDRGKEKEWQQQGAKVAVADVLDTKRLSAIFRNGERLFLLNPPADPSGDTVKEEEAGIHAILDALLDSPIQQVVAESTYGAQAGERIGDLGILYEMEIGLQSSGKAHRVIRGAYYMSNWDSALVTAREEGVVHTLYPTEFKLPMVAPSDLGNFAAQLLMEPIGTGEIFFAEGPARYSSDDVAAGFAKLLRKPVKAISTPKTQWAASLKKQGFSEQAAQSMVKMTELTLAQEDKNPKDPHRGVTTLENYIAGLLS